jgi:hypothetical protein
MRFRNGLIFVSLAWLMLGCATTGIMNARLLLPGQPTATPIRMEYATELFGAGGSMTATLPSGEVFSGRYLQITSAASGDTLGTPWGGWGPWGPYWTDWGPFGTAWVAGDDYAAFVQNYNGKVVATLFGNRGDTMRCRFQLAAPENGMAGGGVGECQTSMGEKIEAQF